MLKCRIILTNTLQQTTPDPQHTRGSTLAYPSILHPCDWGEGGGSMSHLPKPQCLNISNVFLYSPACCYIYNSTSNCPDVAKEKSNKVQSYELIFKTKRNVLLILDTILCKDLVNSPLGCSIINHS